MLRPFTREAFEKYLRERFIPDALAYYDSGYTDISFKFRRSVVETTQAGDAFRKGEIGPTVQLIVRLHNPEDTRRDEWPDDCTIRIVREIQMAQANVPKHGTLEYKLRETMKKVWAADSLNGYRGQQEELFRIAIAAVTLCVPEEQAKLIAWSMRCIDRFSDAVPGVPVDLNASDNEDALPLLDWWKNATSEATDTAVTGRAS